MPEPHLMRARVLLEHDRYADAEKELAKALAEAPEHGEAHALMGFVRWRQNRLREAKESLRQAIALDPDEPLPHRLLGLLHCGEENLIEAKRCAEKLLELAPQDPESFLLRAYAYVVEDNAQEALRTADAGLALDPEHEDLLNLKSRVLNQLGRRKEATAVAEQSLSRAPDSADAHAAKGMALLYRGRIKEAQSLFRESLRLNPEDEEAKSGLVEAIKARNPIYRVLLAYFIWMAGLDGRVRTALIIALYFVARALRAVAEQMQGTGATVIWVLLGLYIAFVALTWLGGPLFNLMLRLHPIGWQALTRQERYASDVFGLSMLAGLILAGLGWLFAQPPLMLIGGFCALMGVVASVAMGQTERPRRTVMVVTGSIMLIAGGAAIVCGVMGIASAAAVAGLVFFLALIVYMFSPTINLSA